MANASFTRDEAILALDVLYFSSDNSLSANSKSIKELCELLQTLPIHEKNSRRADFRNETGVSKQLSLFRASYRQEKKNPNVGKIFYEVAREFDSDPEQIHCIANAIRKNVFWFENPYGAFSEEDGFPEGVLLGHLHRMIERRDSKRVHSAERCSICQLEPELLYRPCGKLLENHLVIDPCDVDPAKKYSPRDFITVCPNCHAALHRVRPWLNRNTCEALLR